MATINMNAVQFYNPSSTAPSLSARCAATLQKYRQSTAIPHRKEQSHVFESYSQSQNTDEDDEFLPVDEVIRLALPLKDSTKKPTNSALAAQGTNETSFLNSSSSSMPTQSNPPSHLNSSKGTCIDSAPLQTKRLLIDAQSSQSYLKMTMNDDDDDDDDNDNDDKNDDNSNSTSSRGISSGLSADGTGRELGPPSSPTIPYPSSRPSSSRDPSLHPSAAPHDQSLEGQAIQQDDGCIGHKMLEQPSSAALILSDDEDGEIEKGQQQQEAGDVREQVETDNLRSPTSQTPNPKSNPAALHLHVLPLQGRMLFL